MTSQEPTSRPNYTRIVVLTLVAATALQLFLQTGNPLDDSEHLHIAWLMAHGLHPIHDFFEHHTPLLWWVLEPIFLLGVPGPESLYVARGLVVVCAAIWVAGLRRLTAPPGEERGPLGGALPGLCFVLTVVYSESLFVTRPEILSYAAMAVVAVLWHTRRGPLQTVLAGALFAIAVFASPRFVLLAPIFLVLEHRDGRGLELRALAGVAAGGVLASAGLLAVYPLGDLLFDLRFSTLLQDAGEQTFVAWRYLGIATGVTAAFSLVLIRLGQVPRRPLVLWGAWGAAISLVCAFTAGTYVYAQAFAPAYAWLMLFAARIEATAKLEARLAGALRDAALATALIVILIAVSAVGGEPYSTVALARSRRMLLDALPPNPTVLLIPTEHPISVLDASYWGSLLLQDSLGKVCSASAEYARRYPHAQVQLPSCSLLPDLVQNHPDAVSSSIYLSAPRSEFDPIERELAQHYSVTNALDQAPTHYFGAGILMRVK